LGGRTRHREQNSVDEDKVVDEHNFHFVKERKSWETGYTTGTGGRGDPRKRVLSKERNLIDQVDTAWEYASQYREHLQGTIPSSHAEALLD
jgi:hypothetical protein